MPKYDAFGREIGENTLSGLGGIDATVHADPSPAPSPAPAPAEDRTDAPAPEAPILRGPDAPAQPIKVRRARGLGCLVGMVILAAVVAGPIIAVVSIVGEATDTIDDVTGVFDDLQTADPPAIAEPELPPVGIAGRSMIAPGNVADAFARLRSDGVKQVQQITIRPERLEADAVKGGRVRDVVFSAGGGVERGDASRANDALGTIPLADLDPKTPARLVRNSAKRYGVRERGINYVIAMEDVFSGDGGHRWVAYFKNGVYVEGDERGRVIRRID